MPRPTKRIRTRNPKNAKRNFAADFGSKEFIEMIHALPCAHCGVYGWTEAAHLKSRGAGGKAAENIVPLCGSRLGVKGCHQRYDDHSEDVRQHYLRFKTLAKKLWNDWQSHQHQESE